MNYTFRTILKIIRKLLLVLKFHRYFAPDLSKIGGAICFHLYTNCKYRLVLCIESTAASEKEKRLKDAHAIHLEKKQ